MKIAYNFVSLVTLGNFNPAIVTPDFLNKDCELNLGEPTDQSPPFVPVHKHLQFQIHGLTRLINISKKKDSFNLNYNYEAGNLDQNKSSLDLLLDGYKEFCDEFLSFMKFLEG